MKKKTKQELQDMIAAHKDGERKKERCITNLVKQSQKLSVNKK
jgi:hypothetical protein